MKLRSRIIRPGFFSNEELAENDPLGRILFEGLWCLADKSGRLEDRPKKIKALILPYDDVNVNKLLDNLYDSEFIIRYSVDSSAYIFIPEFLTHQQVYHKEEESQIPDYQDVKALLKLSGSYPVATNKSKSKHKSKSKQENKRKNKEIIELIISDLNEKSRKNFKYCKANIDIINPRIDEGRTVEDFFHINTVKCQEWLDTKQEKYIRPETLYAKIHFESYLNQKIPDVALSKFSPAAQQTILNMKKVLERDKQNAINGKAKIS